MRAVKSVVLAKLTEGLADQVELVHVGLAGPQRNAGEELGEDAADGPHIHGGAVLRVPHQQFGGTVPAGGHVVRVRVARPRYVHGESNAATINAKFILSLIFKKNFFNE